MSTSISGSGPAYIFMLMEAMIDAGVHMGFSRETATSLVHHTLLGSTIYAMETGEHPAILRNMVTSPAGTTASAIYELENGKFRVVIKDVSVLCTFGVQTCRVSLTVCMLRICHRRSGHATEDLLKWEARVRMLDQEECTYQKPLLFTIITAIFLLVK